jgi:hypothetical protein
MQVEDGYSKAKMRFQSFFIRTELGRTAKVETRTRRLIPAEATIDFMLVPSHDVSLNYLPRSRPERGRN